MTTPNNLTGTPKEQLKANILFSSAMILGLCIFLAAAVMIHDYVEKEKALETPLLIIIPLLALVCLFSALTIYKKRMEALKEKNLTFLQKLGDQRAALILYFALCEGPALFAIIAFILTGNIWFIVIVVIMLLAMLTKFPSKKKLINDMQLDWQEQQEL